MKESQTIAEDAVALCRLSGAEDRFDISSPELDDAQLAAMDQRFQEAKGRIRLVRLRSEEGGLDAIRSLDDVVQLLLPHTAYKSYPENWLLQKRWDRLTTWLQTVSAHPIEAIDSNSLDDIDEWLSRLEQAGHFVSCSSGTTGKSAMLAASRKDLEWASQDVTDVFSWGADIKPAQDRLVVNCVGVAEVPKNIVTRNALKDAFGNPSWDHWEDPVPPITVGTLTNTIIVRKAIAEGQAKPNEIAEFERISNERQKSSEAAVSKTAEFLIENREKKLLLIGFWGGFHPIAKVIREKGYSATDFHPDNALYVGGGLKGAQLPDDFQDFIYETFGIQPKHHFQMYSMQEINSGMPQCQKGGRYHVPPWLVPLVLNKAGDALAEPAPDGTITGRAGFFDLSLDGRWGGVISGDMVTLDRKPCPCGNRGPTIHNNIVRYSDMEGDDKIGCAGTIDAYIQNI